jgi:tyrosyl-tRNA synthetase
VDAATLEAAFAELPRATLTGELPPVLDLLIETGLASSRGDARRTISEGGAYLNNRRVTDVAAAPAAGDLLHGRWLLLRRGKRNQAVVERTPGG